MKKILTTVILFSFPVAANAGEEISPLQNSFDFLLSRILELESRLLDLEESVGQQIVPASSSKNVSPSIALWRQLRRGMTKVSVRAILGEPSKIIRGPYEHWCYGSIGECEQIYISNATLEFDGERLRSWREP